MTLTMKIIKTVNLYCCLLYDRHFEKMLVLLCLQILPKNQHCKFEYSNFRDKHLFSLKGQITYSNHRVIKAKLKFKPGWEIQIDILAVWEIMARLRQAVNPWFCVL